jgi:hypothetical protein
MFLAVRAPNPLAGVGDNVIHETEMNFPKKLADSGFCAATYHWPAMGRGGSKGSGTGEIVPGHLASSSLIAARITGGDPKVLAAVIRGAVAPMWPAEPLRAIEVHPQ